MMRASVIKNKKLQQDKNKPLNVKSAGLVPVSARYSNMAPLKENSKKRKTYMPTDTRANK